MPTLLAYVRKSFYNDANATDRDAVGRRWHAIEAFAQARGLRVEPFEDLDITGKYEAGRAGWADLLTHLDDPGVWGVCIEDWRDCHRNVKEFLQFYDDQLAPRGLGLICLNHPSLNPATADGRMLITNLMALNEWEARKSSERRAASIRYKQTVLGRHFGRTPFGCSRDPISKHLTAAPTAYWLNLSTGEAFGAEPSAGSGCERRYYFDALQTLFTLFAPGTQSLGDTANQLNAAGWRCWASDYKTPVKFNRWNVYSILKHWYLYAGQLMPYEKPKAGSRPTQQAGHAPILPMELCEAVQAALQHRHVMGAACKPLTSHAGRRIYLLSGLLFCHACGQRLSGQWTGQYLYYRHTYDKGGCTQKAVQVHPLERQVLDGLKLLVGQTDLLNDVIEELRTILRLTEDGDAGSLAHLEQAKSEHDRLIDLYTQGLITMQEFTRRRDALAAEIARLENETASHPARALADGDTISQILTHLNRLDEADPLLLKNILYDLFERLEVENGRIVAATPRPWAIPLFSVCRLWAGLESGQQSLQVRLPDWLSLPCQD